MELIRMVICNRKRKLITVLAIMLVIVPLLYSNLGIHDTEHPRKSELEYVSYVEFQEMLKEGNVDTVYFAEANEDVYFTLKDGTYRGTSNPQYDDFKKDLLNYDTVVRPMIEMKFAETVESEDRNCFTAIAVISAISYLSLFYFWYAKSRVTAGTEAGATDSSSNYSGQNTGKHFSDVA